MGDEDKDKTQPSLEPPKLFGRKKRSASEPAASPDRASPPDHADDQPTTVTEPVPEPSPIPSPAPVPVPTPTPPPMPGPQPTPSPEPVPTPEPTPAPSPQIRRAEASEPGTPLFADEVATTRTATADQADAEPAEGDAAEGEASRPILTGRLAAAATGLLVGGLIVGLTTLAFRLCELVRGTASCGSPGFALLVAILVASVFVGGLLLKLFQVPDPGSTSFLAVGLVAVISLLFLVDIILTWPMILVIPAVSVLTYVLSHWVTTTFVEPADHG